MRHNILLVAKESNEYMELQNLLKHYHFDVVQRSSSRDALLELKQQHTYKLVILDINLADIYGIELCKLIRQIDDHLPIVFISEVNDITETVLCFEAGADDYIHIPYNSQILLARLKTRLRHKQNIQEHILTEEPLADSFDTTQFKAIEFGAWTYHPHKCTVVHNVHGEVFLTDKENILLKLFLSDPSKIHPREVIAKFLNLGNSETITRDVNIHIHRLRNKLTHGNNIISPIKSVRSKGYTLDAYLHYSYDGQKYKFM